MKYLISGHTGFKGTWLSAILVELGHQVVGISLPAPAGGIHERASIDSLISNSNISDIRDFESVNEIFQREKPNRVIHLAAQSLVSEGYSQPIQTFETNVNGTLNILRAVKELGSVESTIIVTTDKVYKNTGKISGYTEDDPLGGVDPYSASKAMADILSQSWSNTFSSDPIGILRAGNVIGGGDVSKNRLMPDLVAAVFGGEKIQIRNPKSVRPWQHVLDCLYGYLLAESRIAEKRKSGIWNFGPKNSDFASVETVVALSEKYANTTLSGCKDVSVRFDETAYLTLDSTKAREQLSWNPTFSLEDSVRLTLDWESRSRNSNPRFETIKQIQDFLSIQQVSL